MADIIERIRQNRVGPELRWVSGILSLSFAIMYSRISLTGKGLGEKAGKAIADALKTNTTLTTLEYDPLARCLESCLCLLRSCIHASVSG
jgi:hypothetical protein